MGEEISGNSLNYKEERWIKHYCSSHKILLVGEGDFSFSACLAKAFGSATNMVATSLDSKEELMRKYTAAKPNLKVLELFGCTIIHEVDCRTMSQHNLLITREFDRVVFNFPHDGFTFPEHNFIQIQYHQKLVKGFFTSARNILTKDGEVHITHKTANPFDKWEVENLAEEVGLRLVDKVCFSRQDYPGYINKRGQGCRSNRTFRVGKCSTFKFASPSISVESHE